MKTYKFLELNNKAKIKAVNDYIKGWEETHKVGDLSYNEAYNILAIDLTEDEYSKSGELINFEE